MSKKAKNVEANEVPAAVTETGMVAQTQAGLPAAAQAPSLAAWGTKPINVDHVVIPRILPQQPLSKFVTSGTATMGDLMESVNGTKLGSCQSSPIEFIPFHHVENWIIFEEKNGAMKFTKIEPVTPANKNWPREEVINGVKIRRDLTLEFFVLLASDIAKGVKRPYVLSFRRTSIKAGKKLYTTMFVTNASNGKNPAATVCKLSGAPTKNDKGVFMVMDVTEARESTVAEQTAAFEWYKTVAAGQNVAVDNSEFETEEAATAPVTGEAQF